MIVPVLLLASLLAQRDSTGPRLVDGFEDARLWSAHPADGVKASVHSDRGHTGRGLRLDFDFQGGGGYAIARRTLPLDLPPNYALSFWIRGRALVNTLEFKLIDGSGENVWWYTERDRPFSGEWQRVTIRRRQISFAWGPLGGGELSHAAALELVVTAGQGGGRGSVWFDDLVLTPLPPPGRNTRAPVARATAALPRYGAGNAVDGDSTTAWRAAAKPVDLTVDFGEPREFGGISLAWLEGNGARDYNVLLSGTGAAWEVIRKVRGGNGGRDDLFLPNKEGRYLRLQMLRPEGETGYGLREITLLPVEVGESLNAFWTTVSKGAPQGTYPRYFSGRRAYWTVVGLDSAREEALINEDGAIEAGKGLFSVEPFLADSGRLYSWADARTKTALAEGDLPLPSVTWTLPGLELTVSAFAIGPASSSSVVARYRVRNTSPTARAPTLYLAVRPFQVNPPWQFLNTPGGAAKIESLEWGGQRLKVNGDRLVIPFTAPAQVAATTYDGGEIVSHLRDGRLPATTSVRDGFGAASGALAWSFRLAPGDTATAAIEIPLTTSLRANLAPGSLRLLDQAEAETIGWWEEALNRATIRLPAAGDHLARTIRSTLGWIMVNRDEASIQPGSRSYERSWIRDGSLTSAALLRFGHPEMVRDFIRWYAAHLYADGKVPCCVDRRGADPVPEHDSHGEFIYLVMEYWRHTGDTTLLASMWPRVLKAAGYIDSLRQTHRTPEYQDSAKRVFWGLLPPSISHEGYSAKPMHSYWDDFFALRGLKDAAAMALVLHHDEKAARLGAMRDEFRRDLLASLERVRAEKRIEYLPGAADLGDFDATSTTIALTPVGEQANLPADALRQTFERYWQQASVRWSSDTTWEAYTPYELRSVGALLRLFGRERALTLLNHFLDDQEPPGWNQWPEVVWRDRRAPKFIGDSPHTWVGSDFLRSASDLFAYEEESDSSLVIAAGVDQRWLADSGVAVRGVSTWWGPLSYTMRQDGERVVFHLDGGLTVPPGGVRLVAPAMAGLRQVTVNGGRATLDGGSLRLRSVPADVIFEY
ncbi:MAG TPA: discoidin domain-containing protein [Gemmatimonadales bacterium]|nr:discoidin domain-containing protein [Gemmatimonadales bacterium]